MWHLTWSGDQLHSVPTGDPGQHWLDAYCPCLPDAEVDGSGFVLCSHNAWDGREKTERESVGLGFTDREAHTLDSFQALR